ncbi:MAG: YbaY family lipoprotein [Rudaea sp.]
MRSLIATPLVAALLLSGCGSSAPPPPAKPTVAPIPNSVTGSITLREPRELSEAAKADVKVVNVAQPELVLAQATVPNANKFPVAFSLPIDPSKVDPKATYALEAMLTDGGRRFLPVLQYPVLTNKPPTSKVEVLLAPEPTPSEKMFEEYRKAFAQIGTFKQISGSSLNEKSTSAWDAFLSNGKVKVVRETTDLDEDKGRIIIRVAYKDDDPWVVVRDECPPGSNRPFATTKVGWDEHGTLVLRERTGGGDVSDGDAKALYAHAQAAYKVALARAPAPKK